MDFLQSGINLANDVSNKAKKAVADLNKATLAPREASMARSVSGFNANKYAVSQHSYPKDVLSEVYGGNYVVFYINVAQESRLNIKDNTVELDPTIEKRLRGSLIAKNMNVATLAGANAATQILGGLGGGISKVIKQGYAPGTGKKGTETPSKLSQLSGGRETIADAAGAAVGVMAVGTLAPDAARSQRRLKTAIALHVPNQLSVRYGMQWSEEDTAAVQGMADAIQAATARQGAINRLGSIAREGAAAAALQKMPNSGAASAALGIASNPKKEQTFRGVDFRKFTFDYQFFPRDEVEAQNVLNIIQEFKVHMHPEFKSKLNYVYIYPSEFDIIYYSGGSENLNLHRHTSCVLEEMNVNYTPNGSYSTFANGMPTQINVSLGFKELQLLSKETVEGGL